MAINRIKTGGITDGTIQSGDIAPGTVASDRIAPGTIANDRLANTSITINGTAIALGASGEIVAGTDWQAVTVADGSTILTAEAGKGYFLDTNTGVIEVILPTSPSRGDTVVLADYGGNFATDNVIVRAGSNLIDSVETVGSGQGYKLSTNNLVVELVYVDSSKGWFVQENEAKSSLTAAADTNAFFTEATGGTVLTDGDFKIHVFTGDGCFVVSNVGNPGGSGSKVSYLVVAGGGGPSFDAGGGGGAGGYREGKVSSHPHTASPLAATPCSGLEITAQTYPITVGGGGTARTNSDGSYAGAPTAQTGSNSIFSTITSAGGGSAQGNSPPYGSGTASTAGSGGSGGGLHRNAPGPLVGGLGNTPPVSPPQGNNGGGSPAPTVGTGSGGGGGAGAAGGNLTTSPRAGAGGNGVATQIIPGTDYGVSGPTSGRWFAGGGGGGYDQPGGLGGTGGEGGGGRGGARNPAPEPDNGIAGTANTGGGAGGMGAGNPTRAGGAGGKGIVAIRYKFQN